MHYSFKYSFTSCNKNFSLIGTLRLLPLVAIHNSLTIVWRKQVIIYQSSKLSFLCVSLVESVSREIGKIRLSPSHQRAREIMHYSPVNNKKSRAPSREHATFGQPKTANVLWITLCTEFNGFFRKLIKYFMYFRVKFALYFRFFDSRYIIKYLLTETEGSSMFCGPSTADVSLGFASGNIDNLGSKKHAVSLGLSQ